LYEERKDQPTTQRYHGSHSKDTKNHVVFASHLPKASVLLDRTLKLFSSKHTLKNRSKFLNTFHSFSPGVPGSLTFLLKKTSREKVGWICWLLYWSPEVLLSPVRALFPPCARILSYIHTTQYGLQNTFNKFSPHSKTMCYPHFSDDKIEVI
jgi:hypothetical protein